MDIKFKIGAKWLLKNTDKAYLFRCPCNESLKFWHPASMTEDHLKPPVPYYLIRGWNSFGVKIFSKKEVLEEITLAVLYKRLLDHRKKMKAWG